MKETRKIDMLKAYFYGKKRVLIAFSGGVDSGLLLYISNKVNPAGTEAAVIKMDFVFPRETRDAVTFCKDYGIKYKVFEVSFANKNYIWNNGLLRCYYCKKEMFAPVSRYAAATGINLIVEGSNVDDKSDFRPGMRATGELGIEKPYITFGITKKYIRSLSARYKLPFAHKPSMCCAATRIMPGERITIKKLEKIISAEGFLHSIGLSDVRVRNMENNAVIELPNNEWPFFFKKKDEVLRYFRELKFSRILFDIEGYRAVGKRIGGQKGLKDENIKDK